MSRRALINIADLFPTQAYVHGRVVREIGEAMLSGVEPPALAVVPYEQDGQQGYILPDGHHRTRAHHDIGMTVIWADVHETDDDVQNSSSAAVARLTTVGEVVDSYRFCWRPSMLRQGIIGIDDFLNVKPKTSRREYSLHEAMRKMRAGI